MSNRKLNTLKNKYIKHKNAEKIAKEKSEEIENKMINETLIQFQDQKDREKLINNAKKYYFSAEKVKRIEAVFSEFNQDVMNYNIVSDIIEMSDFVEERKRESFFSKISNVIPEEDDTE